jgi:hypothetical protein
MIPEHSESFVTLFWEKVTVKEPDQCWEWTAARIDGYGYYRHYMAHRVAYELHHGVHPGKLKVCHTCDNPPCCNPHHLFLGTQKENVADMNAKGRGNPSRGEQVHTVKITEDDVREIRRLHASGVTQVRLGADYGLSQSNVWHIVHRSSWKHVKD